MESQKAKKSLDIDLVPVNVNSAEVGNYSHSLVLRMIKKQIDRHRLDHAHSYLISFLRSNFMNSHE